MNILQVTYIVIATYFLSFGLFYLAQSIFIYKKKDRHLYFALASLFGTVFVLCTIALSTSTFFKYALLIHKIKFIALLWAATFWVYSTYDIFFKKSKIPRFFLWYVIFWSILIMFSNHFLSQPIKTLYFKVLNQSIIYLHGTVGILYQICALGILFIFMLTAYKIIKKQINLKKKIIGLLIVAPGIVGGIHDSLVLNNLLAPPLILEFIIFVFLIATFSIFFSEQRERYLRIQNINKELEDKVVEKTKQLSNASKLMWNAYREQKQANKLKAEMLQIAAHDMKSPLQGIVGYSELLMAQFSDNKTLVERVQKILNSSDHMLTIIQQLLEEEAKKIEQPTLSVEECNFSQLVEYVLDRNYPKALSKQQTLNYKIEPNCIIKGDKTKLVEIADNLVNNAIKYTYEKGEIEVSVYQDNSNIYLLVKDNGQGLSENDLQMLFKKFQRLSSTPTAGEQSTGLGLFIVDKFVKMHGGEIKVTSSVNNGSEFIVVLPKLLSLEN